MTSEESKYIKSLSEKTFSNQAIALLDACWSQLESEAGFIYTVLWKMICEVDMDQKGIFILQKYNEGNTLTFDVALHYYQKLDKYLASAAHENLKQGSKLDLSVMTAVERLNRLKSRNNLTMSTISTKEDVSVTRAREALEDVNREIKKYEDYKFDLTEKSKLQGVKGLSAVNQLAQIESSPMKETLNKKLCEAQAAIRKAMKSNPQGTTGPNLGSVWWLNKNIEEKSRYYSKKNTATTST